MIKVGRVTDPGAYPVDRKTPLGNPFVMKTEADRPIVCRAFRQFLFELHNHNFNASPRSLALRIAADFNKANPGIGLTVSSRYNPSGVDIWNAVNFLLSPAGQKRLLGCHCTPLECHGHTIARYLEWLLSNNAAMTKFKQ
jgi:hypothetical protein